MSIKKITKGFTLIELLVVIAIIGVLASVVLASLNSARSKGNDAGVKANLSSISTQAALFLSDNNNAYGIFNDGTPTGAAACPVPGTAGATVFHESTIARAIEAAVTDSSGGAAVCLSTNSAYVVAVSRPADVASSTSAYWCADGAGNRCGVNSTTFATPVCTCVTSQ